MRSPRLMAASRWALAKLGDAALVEKYLRSVILNELLVDYGQIFPIFHYLMAAAEASTRPVPQFLRRELLETHCPVCYSCGVDLDRRSSDDKNSATVDHLWPQSLGQNRWFAGIPLVSGSSEGESSGWARTGPRRG